MKWPWVSRELYEREAAQSEKWFKCWQMEFSRNADLTRELLTMRKNGFEIVDLRPIEQPITVDEADAEAAQKQANE